MTYRQIHTQIWKDEWFMDLETDEKLLFVYLFSNENTTLAGIYKLNMKVAEFETGITAGRIREILARFTEANKVFYDNGIVWVVNLMRYNATSDSPKIQACIAKELKMIPECNLKEAYLAGNIPYPYPIDRLPINNTTQHNNNNNTVAGENPAAASYEYFPIGADLEQMFCEITGMITFPGKTRGSDIERLEKIYKAMPDPKNDTVPYCRRYFSEWKKRGYNTTNTDWLDWAISREIPKKREVKKEEVYNPEDHATEVYQ